MPTFDQQPVPVMHMHDLSGQASHRLVLDTIKHGRACTCGVELLAELQS